MTETAVVRLVVALLGTVALLSLSLLGALALLERDGSEILVAALSATGTTALGALASMLVSTRSVDPAPTWQQAAAAAAEERDLALQGFDRQPGDLLPPDRGHADLGQVVVIALGILLAALVVIALRALV